MRSFNAFVRRLPFGVMQFAASQGLLCIPIWLLYVLGSPLVHVKLLAAVAGAVLLSLLALPYAHSAVVWLGSCCGWLQQQWYGPTSSRTAQSPPTVPMPPAVRAILELSVAAARGIDWSPSRDPPAAADAPVITAKTGIDCPASSTSVATAMSTAETAAAAMKCGDPRVHAGSTTATHPAVRHYPHNRAPAGPAAATAGSGGAAHVAAAYASAYAFGAAKASSLPRSIHVSARVGSSSLKAPVGLSRCTIVEDAPFPPPNTQVVMELHEKTLRVGRRRLRYRGYRPADRTLPPPPLPFGATVPAGTTAAAWDDASQLADGGGSYALPPVDSRRPPNPAAAAASAGGTLSVLAHLAAGSSPLGALAPLHYTTAQPYPHHAHHHPQPPHYQHHDDAHHRPQPLQYHHHQQLSMSIKVPWAQPTALPTGGGGLLESLNEALANGSGYMVVGAAVRRGCILFQVDVVATSGSGVELLSGIGMPSAASGGGGSRRGDGGGGAANGGELAAQLARHIGMVAPPPPDGSEVLVSVGGRLSYAFSYDAPTAEWSGGPAPAQAPALPRRLQGPYGVRLHPDRPAAVVPAAAASAAAKGMESREGGGGAAGAAPPMLRLAMQLEVADEAAAALLADQLRPLLRTAPSAPRHGGTEGWQMVANCLGRSLPVFVLRVVAPGRGTSASSVEDTAAAAAAAATEPVPRGSLTAATIAGGGGGATTLGIEVGVLGVREALEGTSCRLAVLSVELWYGIQEVVQAPVMLVHEAAALPPCLAFPPPPGQPADDDGDATAQGGHVPAEATQVRSADASVGACDGGNGGWDDGGGGVALSVAAELCELAAGSAAKADDAPEDEQCVRQMFADLGMLELYVASQLRGAVAAAAAVRDAVQDEHGNDDRDGGCCGVAADAWPRSCSPPLSWSSDGADEQQLGEDESPPPPPPTGPPPALLLSGSIDLSAQLQQLLARDDARQRQSMLLTGANLLSYTVLHAMPYTANAIRQGLAALGCGLAEADELSAAYAGTSEDYAIADDEDDPWVSGTAGATATAHLGPGEEDGGGERGLPLMHLAVLSGSPAVVQMVLRWAAEEGLGADWVQRRHRGRSPLQLAAAAANTACGGGDDGGGGDARAVYLALLAPLERRGDVSGGQAAATDVTAPYSRQDLATAEAAAPFCRAADLVSSSSSSGDGDGGGGGRCVADRDMWAADPWAADVGTIKAERSGGGGAGDRGALRFDGAAKVRTGVMQPLEASLAIPEKNRVEVGDYKAARAAGGRGGATAAAGDAHFPADHSGGGGGFASLSWCRRHRQQPLLVSLLGYADPAIEAQYRRFVLPYDAHVASYWIPVMCFLLASALLRPLRGGGGGGSDPSELPVALLFAWPYVLLAAGLMLRPSWVHDHLPRWWLLCGAARLSIKWPVCGCGLLPTPPSMLRYMRSGVTLVTDTLLPGLCERVPGPPGLALRLMDAAAHCYFLMATGVAPRPATALLHALLRAGLFLAASLAVECRHRARFERASAEAAAAPDSVARSGGQGAPGSGRRAC